ncbi:MAG: MBL fold metallo-hydrolase [Nitrospirales bacterium]|nr:MAG: MBL fold metallo-hydrolase [Nitrospirales bacterium]
MADLNKRLTTNVEGDFFVDATCINCDTCRQLAPMTFQEVDEFSAVYHQPHDELDIFHAYQALLACPVGSIGAVTKNTDLRKKAQESFPIELTGGVYYNGFNSEKSFGANSYFVTHSQGNWLIDSPRFLRHLVNEFQNLGGIRYIFLSHEDDVADADRYAEKFNATRIIHEADHEAMPDAEWIVKGNDVVQASPVFQLIPVPGHTAGSLALLYKEKFLFTGDHLWWDREKEELGMPSRLVWNAEQLLQSTQRLLDFSFEWVLPGHGDRIQLSPERMRRALTKLLASRQKT